MMHREWGRIFFVFDIEGFFEGTAKEYLINFANIMTCYEECIHSSKLDLSDFWWQKDGHHNAKDYQMMSECIFSYLVEHSPLSYLYKNYYNMIIIEPQKTE
jgi:hypothetical protein